MVKKTKKTKKDLDPESFRLIWRCDCGLRIVLDPAESARRVCPRCGRTDTYSITRQVITK